MGLFAHISMATMTTFPGTNLIIKKINWAEFFSGAIPSPNIPGLACAKQDVPLPDSRINAFKPPLSSAIIHGLLLY